MVDAASQQARDLLSTFGTCVSQAESEWTGAIPLPAAVARFYRDVGPVDLDVPQVGNDVHIPSLAKLWDLQVGYRWDARSGQPSDGWDDHWLVIASCGGDPFIFDIATGELMHAIHGTGRWSPTEFVPDLSTFAASIGLIGKMLRNSEDVYDDDFEIRPEWTEATLRKLSALLGGDGRARSVLIALGYPV